MQIVFEGETAQAYSTTCSVVSVLDGLCRRTPVQFAYVSTNSITQVNRCRRCGGRSTYEASR